MITGGGILLVIMNVGYDSPKPVALHETKPYCSIRRNGTVSFRRAMRA